MATLISERIVGNVFNCTTGTHLAKSRPENSIGPITRVLSHQDAKKKRRWGVSLRLRLKRDVCKRKNKLNCRVRNAHLGGR